MARWSHKESEEEIAKMGDGKEHRITVESEREKKRSNTEAKMIEM